MVMLYVCVGYLWRYSGQWISFVLIIVVMKLPSNTAGVGLVGVGGCPFSLIDCL